MMKNLVVGLDRWGMWLSHAPDEKIWHGHSVAVEDIVRTVVASVRQAPIISRFDEFAIDRRDDPPELAIVGGDPEKSGKVGSNA